MLQHRPGVGTRSVIFVAVIGMAGCAAPSKDGPSYHPQRAILVGCRSPEADALWEAAKDVLREHGFTLDRVDRRAGVITTMPLTSRQIFEFWRKDVRTTADLWEATINPIRRWVEVRFADGAENEAWRSVEIAVHKERFSSPDRQFNSTGAAYQYFGDRLPATTGAPRVSPADERWLEIGRDAALEDYLAGLILKRAGVTPTSAAPEPASHHTPSD